ncbi:hypothetical protein FRC07_003249 [Ceratobasidium sp. 392]|nr:hypothetical protein FRC07_003249 [Ceratobasidium sp. 392]
MWGQELRKALTGLMTPDAEALGYNAVFTTDAERNGHPEFYPDWPASSYLSDEETAIPKDIGLDTTAISSSAIARYGGPPTGDSMRPTRRPKPMKRRDHSKDIRGRRTIIFQVGEITRSELNSEVDETQECVKTCSQTKEALRWPKEVGGYGTQVQSVWNDSRAEREGLGRLGDVYGVVPYMWKSNVFEASSPGWVPDSLTDRNIEPLEKMDGEEAKGEVGVRKYPAHFRHSLWIHRRPMPAVGSSLCSLKGPRQLLQVVLDAVLSYWGLASRGLLHRDISCSNVLMLLEHGFKKQELKPPQTTTNKNRPVVEELGRLFQDMPDNLNYGPTGILSDFDLVTMCGMVGTTFFNDPSTRYKTSDLDEHIPKWRRLNLIGAASLTCLAFDTNNGSETTTSKGSCLCRVGKVTHDASRINSRTGTPAFMSSRVLRVPIGQRYEHHFMDDLESFLWVLLWCVAEHTDVRGAKATDTAHALLNGFSQRDLNAVAFQKDSLLRACRKKGNSMRNTLSSFSNAWAADPTIVSVILKLGSYLNEVEVEELSECIPDKVFPEVVDFFIGALKA